MASLIKTLTDILEAEVGCYQKLYDMADNKKEVIINGDVPSLQEITNVEQALAGHILRLEKKREENLDDICLVTNRKREDMTVRNIVTLIKGDESLELEKAANHLESIIHRFKRKNEINKMLIEQSLEYVDFTMNAVQSMQSGPASNNYEKRGNPYGDAYGNNFFDAKQ